MCMKMYIYLIFISWFLLNIIYLFVFEVGFGGVARNFGFVFYVFDVSFYIFFDFG